MDPSYNNSFGSFANNGGQPVQSAPVLSPVGGDIVLASQPKKKKVGLIVGIVLIITLIIVGIVTVILVGGRGNSNDARFKDFVSLVLHNGSDKYPTDKGLYAIQVAAIAPVEEEMDAYFDAVREKGAELIKNGDNNKDLIKKVLLWTYIADFYNFYDDDTVVVYEDGGYEVAGEMLDNRYDLISIADDLEYSEIVSTVLFAEKVYLDYIKEYEAGGCSMLKEVDDCVVMEVSTDELDSVLGSFDEIYEYARNMMDEVIPSLAGGNK